MADNKNKNINNNDVELEDDGSLFYDNTAGTIFSADSDAETGSTKSAKQSDKKKQKQEKGGKPKNNKKPIIILVTVVLAVAILLGIYFAVQQLVPDSVEDNTSPTYPTDANGEQYATDLKGNKIDSEKDHKGNILVAGIEELISYVPADIKSVKVENEYGSFEILSETPTEIATDAEGKEEVLTDATIYTLVGYEDAPIETGKPDAVANDAAAIKTTNIVDITGANPEEYGLTKPRATATVEFNDGVKRVITVGNNAPDDVGAYIQVDGDKAIYLVAVEDVDSFLYKLTAMFDVTITDTFSSEGDANPTEVKISGSNFPQELVFVPNTDKTVSAAYYQMTSPTKWFANVSNASNVLGSLRSVRAEEALAYKPDTATLNKYGIDLNNPYAEINAVFSDTTVHLYASKPSDDETAMVNVYNPNSKILYSIGSPKVAWVTTSYEDMVFEHIIKSDLGSIDTIEITANSKSYTFDVNTETKVDAEGNETTTTTVKSGNKTLDTSKFDVFFQNLESATVNSVKTGSVSGTPTLTVKVTYNGDKTADTFTFYKGDVNKYNFSVDGTNIMGDVFATYVDRIIEDAPKAANGEDVAAI